MCYFCMLQSAALVQLSGGQHIRLQDGPEALHCTAVHDAFVAICKPPGIALSPAGR